MPHRPPLTGCCPGRLGGGGGVQSIPQKNIYEEVLLFGLKIWVSFRITAFPDSSEFSDIFRNFFPCIISFFCIILPAPQNSRVGGGVSAFRDSQLRSLASAQDIAGENPHPPHTPFAILRKLTKNIFFKKKNKYFLKKHKKTTQKHKIMFVF